MSAITSVKAAFLESGVDSLSLHMNSSRYDGSWSSVTPLILDFNSIPVALNVLSVSPCDRVHKLNAVIDSAVRGNICQGGYATVRCPAVGVNDCARLDMCLYDWQQGDSSSVRDNLYKTSCRGCRGVC